VRPAFLELDDALRGQPGLRARAGAAGARTARARDLGPTLRLWSRPDALQRLAHRLGEALPAADGPRLVFAGSGDFHHVTPALLARALEASDGGPVTVVHLDNHPDWVRYAGGLHCGSWVGAAARMPGVARLVTVGVCSGDVGRTRRRHGDLALVDEGRLALYAYEAPDGEASIEIAGHVWPTIEVLGLPAFIEHLLAEITTERVYVTLDKDVLRPADAATNWDQGRMSLDELMEILGAVLAARRVIGADVVGDWSAPIYGGGPAARLLKWGEAHLDQPWRSPDRVAANAVNEAVNLRLLDLFAQVGR
jgi:arginase family enzyme